MAFFDDITLRLLTPADLDATYRLEQVCFSHPWPKKSLEQELSHNLHACYLGLFDKKEQIGYGGMWCILDTGFITNIGILPKYQNKGLGRMLMTSLLELAYAKEVRDMTLEVRVGNAPAIHLYQSLGFTPVGVRKNYYADTGEDAYTMHLSLQAASAHHSISSK